MLEFYQQFYSKKMGSQIYTAEYQNYSIAGCAAPYGQALLMDE
jgi:hypothetical protein